MRYGGGAAPRGRTGLHDGAGDPHVEASHVGLACGREGDLDAVVIGQAAGGRAGGRFGRQALRAGRVGAASLARGGRGGAWGRRNRRIGHAATARAGGTRWGADRRGRHAMAATVMFAKRASQ